MCYLLISLTTFARWITSTSNDNDESSVDSTSDHPHHCSIDSACKYLRYRSEYDEGMICFSEPLLLSHESVCVDAVNLFNAGRVHHEQGKFKDALSCYRQSLSILKASQACDVTTKLANLFNIGSIQYSSGDFVDALKTFNEALDFSETAFGPGSMEVAACLNCVGVVHYIMPQGDSDRALEAVSMSLHLRRRTGIRDCHLATTLNNLGRIDFARGDYDQAMSVHQEALVSTWRRQYSTLARPFTIKRIM